MKPSLARYLLVKVVPPALLVNVVINVIVGLVAYPAGRAVPLTGDKSAGADTLVNAFFIGFFTLLVARAQARTEARSGRVRGFDGRSALAAWPRRHPVLAAIAFGLLFSTTLGLATVKVLLHLTHAPLPRGAFVLFKAAFSGGAGVLAAVLATLVGVWPEPDVSSDPRWVRDPPAAAWWPCDYVDKGGLAVTSREHGCSGTPTWQLLVDGALDPAHVRQALADLTARYPSLAARVQALDGVPPLATRYRYAQDPRFTVDDIFTHVDLRADPMGLDALEREHHDRHTDLFADHPVTLTHAVLGDAHSRLFFRQHHAIADGRAFIELLGDFGAFLEAARAGRRPSADALAPIGRRSEVEALALTRGRRIAWTLAGYRHFAGALVSRVLRPPPLLLQNRSNDYTGENAVAHLFVDEQRLAAWERARERLGVSLNSLLTGALFDANRRWHRAKGHRLGRVTGSLVMETRPRDGGFRSFANHLATLVLDVRLDRLDGAQLCRELHAQVKRQRAAHLPEKRLLCERQLVSLMSIEQMQRFVFHTKRPEWNLNFSNLIGLEFPPLGGDGWKVDEVRICTPVTPRTGIALTVIRYRGRLCFNFNFKSTVVSRADVEALRACFSESLDELSA
jgi:hypothetical protein